MATKKTASTINRLDTPNGTGKEDAIGIIIPKIQPQLLEVEIIGTSPLLVCAWSEKAKRQMLEKQMKKSNRGKEAKDPEADYKNSLYVSSEGWCGVPAGGIKGCIVNACRAVDGLPMTVAKRMIFIHSDGVTNDGQELVRVIGEHERHEAMVRIDNGSTADIRFRAIFRKWSMKLSVEFLASMISMEQVLNLIELAGYVEGLCEHRPGAPKSCTGSNGRFRIKRGEDQC